MLRRLKPTFSLAYRAQAKLIMKAQMKKALHVLQLPIHDLSQWLENEINDNPLLEIKNDPHHFFQIDSINIESVISNSTSVYQSLMLQAREFLNVKQLYIAKRILSNLNDQGFFQHNPYLFCSYFNLNVKEFSKVLKVIKSLDPKGVSCKSLQHFISYQLKIYYPQEKLLKQIVDNDFNLLIEKRWPSLSQKYKLSLAQIEKKVISILSKLKTAPYRNNKYAATLLQPDVFLTINDQTVSLEVNHELLPQFGIPSQYEILKDSKRDEEKKFFEKYYKQYEWLKKILGKRKATLTKITSLIFAKQKPFFLENKPLLPLSYKTLAEELNLHETTIRRAVQDKVLSIDGSLVSFDLFFSASFSLHSPTITKMNAKQLLMKIIQEEDKKKPLSDDMLCQQLKKLGIQCSRRTVTKYRKNLFIAPASKRKKFL